MSARLIAASGWALVPILPVWRALAARYGRWPAWRFAAGAAATLLVQQMLVAVALRREGRLGRAHDPGAADLLTLSRGTASAVLVGLTVSGIRDRRGLAGWMAWLWLLYGAVVCDWLDGPIARRLGGSEIGRVFDMEEDSWLTFTSGVAAARWGQTPVYTVLPPVARYIWLLRLARHLSYAEIHAREPAWVRPAGMAQMLLYLASLAPFGGPLTRGLVRIAAPCVAPAQLVVLAVLFRRKRRGHADS